MYEGIGNRNWQDIESSYTQNSGDEGASYYSDSKVADICRAYSKAFREYSDCLKLKLEYKLDKSKDLWTRLVYLYCQFLFREKSKSFHGAVISYQFLMPERMTPEQYLMYRQAQRSIDPEDYARFRMLYPRFNWNGFKEP